MTLPASGTITLAQIAAEFGLASTAIFPTAFYGKGGAPASGTLSFADFYGRSAPAVVVGSITPANEADGPSSLAANTFGAHSLTVTNAASVTYSWSFVSASGGTWTVNSGQGTNSAVPRVASVVAGTTATATFRCTVVADGTTYTRDCTLSYVRTGTVTVGNISPASEDGGLGTLGSKTFSAHSLTVTGAASVTYTWSFVSTVGGSWTVNSGQGTNSAVPRVTSVADGATVTATFRCTVVADGTTYTRDSTLMYSRDSGGGVTMTL